MGKGKKKSGGSWLAEIKLNEGLYGCVRSDIIEIYPHLRDVIYLANNSTVFVPDSRVNTAYEGNDHPYEREIEAFNPSADYLRKFSNFNPVLQVPVNHVAVWITEKDQLVKLVEKLRRASHVFVDLESHSWRSYREITSLVQMSDGTTVYFIDCLKLYREMKLMRPLFLDSSIVKVFHAGGNDIKWLEKDFGIYVAGYMDTQIMYRWVYGSNNISYKDLVHLSFPNAGLEKAVRNTDFRNRPLHPEQEKYAFLDVYYLPFLYYKLLSELSDFKFVETVKDCKKIAKLRYQFPDLLVKNPEDSTALRYLKLARDIAARKENVNPTFLCSIPALQSLIYRKELTFGITKAPVLHSKFFKYKDAISAALRGEDPTSVFETAYRDLGIPFPYRRSMFCFNCESTSHVKRNCPEPKSVGKEKKRLHYLEHPEKKSAQCKRRNQRVKEKPEAKRRRNMRNNRRKMIKRLNMLM